MTSPGASDRDKQVLFGEGYAGSGADAAHINTILGDPNGPLGAVLASTLMSPSPGHVPFMVCLRPNVAVRPYTVFMNKAAYASDTHARLTWGAAQSGVAHAIATAALSDQSLLDMVCLAAVWVAPDAANEDRVYANTRDATALALASARAGGPTVDEIARALTRPSNAYYSPVKSDDS
jgi:5,6,7,8-tetrahydromethanopterin hydro-lyase